MERARGCPCTCACACTCRASAARFPAVHPERLCGVTVHVFVWRRTGLQPTKHTLQFTLTLTPPSHFDRSNSTISIATSIDGSERACLRTCARVRVHMCTCARTHAYVHVHGRIYTRTHVVRPTSVHACRIQVAIATPEFTRHSLPPAAADALAGAEAAAGAAAAGRPAPAVADFSLALMGTRASMNLSKDWNSCGLAACPMPRTLWRGRRQTPTLSVEAHWHLASGAGTIKTHGSNSTDTPCFCRCFLDTSASEYSTCNHTQSERLHLVR